MEMHSTTNGHANGVVPEPSTPLFNGRKATVALNIAIVGCGLGGLAAAYCLAQAGHNITVYEAAPQISEVGAGIQVGPNLTRLLIRWGLGEKLRKVAVSPTAITFRKWSTGETVGWTNWRDMEELHNAPYYHIHRADFLNLLFDLALPCMTLRVNSRVASIDPSAPSLTLQSGEVVHADLIIGADGVKSSIREVVVGVPDRPTDTGDAAYRAIIKTEDMLKFPELRPLIENPEMVGWIGPGRHVMGYCIRGKNEYNIVMLHPDHGAIDESWTEEASGEIMRADFVGWDPLLQKIISLIPTTLNWKLMDRKPLENWIHKDEKVVLLGDACHPMLPYRAQGSAMAVEDGAVLGNLFSHLTHRSQIPALLRAYQSLRYTRATNTQMSSRLNRDIFHLEDGPEQEARDKSMREAMDLSRREAAGEKIPASLLENNPNQWADKTKNTQQFSYDADQVVDEWWRDTGAQSIGAMGGEDITSKM